MNILNIEISLEDSERREEQGRVQAELSRVDPVGEQHGSIQVNAQKPKCSPKKNFVFVRNEGAGGDIHANIMYRAALRFNLLVVPFKGVCFTKQAFKHPDCPLSFLSDIYYSRLGIPNVLLTEHLLDGDSFPFSLMQNNTVHITSMRTPKDQTKSLSFASRNATGTETFSNEGERDTNDWHYWERLCKNSEQFQKSSLKCTKTHKKEDKEYHACVAEVCHKLVQKRIGFISITDQLDESLIMLRRKMCWTHKDIVYASLSTKDGNKKDSSAKGIKGVDTTDEILFNKSKADLQSKINQDRHDVSKEVKHFIKIQYVTGQFCDIIYHNLQANLSNVYEILVSDREVPIPRARWSEGFILDPMVCIMIKLNPKIFNNIFIVRMFPEICKFVSADSGVSLFDFEVKQVEKAEEVGGNAEEVNGNAEEVKRNTTVVHMHPAYCSPLQTMYRIPLDILAHPEAYDQLFK